MDMALTMLVDGSLQVDERIAARSDDPTATTFHRRTPVWRHDGVFDVQATMDGRTFPSGPGAGYVQVGKGPMLDVTWTFEPVPTGTHEFGLSYRAAGVVSLSGIRGTISWLALPADRDFDVADARVTVTLPTGAVLLQDPWVEEPGWQVARLPNGMTAAKSHVARTEPATLGIEFTVDRMAASTPQWQTDKNLTDEFVPAFVSAGLFILVVAWGVLWMVRVKFPRWRVTPEDATGIDISRITPAMRLSIVCGHVRRNRTAIQAALDGLVAAGALRAGDGRLRLLDGGLAQTSHEQLITGEAWLHQREGVSPAALLSRRMRRRVGAALEQDLVTAGLADPDRVRAARDLRRAGVAVLVFGIATWTVVEMTLMQFGAWPLVVPGSIVISGVMLRLGGSRLLVLDRRGAAVRMLYFARASDGRTSA